MKIVVDKIHRNQCRFYWDLICFIILKGLDVAYNILMNRAKGSLFCILFNLRSFLTNSPASISITAKLSDGKFRYSVTDKKFNFNRYFSTEIQGAYIYRYGFKERAERIFSEYLVDHIIFNDGDRIIDIGANLGDFALPFILNKIKINYTGVEPSKVEFLDLEVNCKTIFNKNSFSILDKAAWSSGGLFLPLFVDSERGDSSLIRSQDESKIFDVQTVALDELITAPIKLIKIEAEGAEPEVLRGISKKNLNLIQYVTVDAGFERGFDQSSPLVEVIDIMHEYNFKLERVSHDRVCALFHNTNFYGNCCS